MSTFTVSLILVVAICVSILKPFIELKILPGSQLHDTLIRLIAILTGLVASLVDYLVNTPSWQHGPALEATMGRGLVAGVGAILAYHLLTADVWQTLTPGESTVPTVPGQPPAPQPLVPATITKAEVITPTIPEPAPPVVAVTTNAAAPPPTLGNGANLGQTFSTNVLPPPDTAATQVGA